MRHQVQPRVCGEYLSLWGNMERMKGSTPRMRGILYIFICHPPPVRFNPAYAGNITCVPEGCMRHQVQPRVCGEYKSVHLEKNDLTGSTPRMRGISQTY